jgi:hypothetical protein
MTGWQEYRSVDVSEVPGARRIGFAMSGGGYRAGAWGLGVSLYLADARLNGQVATASSVSGGSITNAVLALQSFREMGPEEVWSLSARVARRLAGNVGPFLLLLAIHAAAWVTAIVGGSVHQPALTGFALGAALLLSLVLAPVCGDATFRSRLI